jgi:hypothetical protein
MCLFVLNIRNRHFSAPKRSPRHELWLVPTTSHDTCRAAIAFLPALLPLSGLAGAWLQACYGGRKVRLKVSPGEIEVEGQTVKQMRELLEIGNEYQRHNSKIIIQEP